MDRLRANELLFPFPLLEIALLSLFALNVCHGVSRVDWGRMVGCDLEILFFLFVIIEARDVASVHPGDRSCSSGCMEERFMSELRTILESTEDGILADGSGALTMRCVGKNTSDVVEVGGGCDGNGEVKSPELHQGQAARVDHLI